MTDTSTVLGGARPAVEHATVAYVKQGFQIAGLPGKELLDLENLRLNLEKKIAQEKIRSYQISGADEGSDEHRLLLYYVFAKGLPGNWGTEFHVRLPCQIGNDAAAAQRGQVILRLTADGHVAAQLVSRGAITLPGSDDVKEIESLLRSQFGVRAVQSKDQLWRPDELKKVYRAFLRIPPDDRSVLKDITLVRVAAADRNEPGIDAYHCQRQQLQGHGAIAADDVFEFQIGNGTFADDRDSFVGRDPNQIAPASFHSILHEVGHAVEMSTVRAATLARNVAGVEANRLATALKNADPSQQQELRERYDVAHKKFTALEAAVTAAEGRGRSRRLDNFVAYVRHHRISPRITRYAASAWDEDRPAEFFAESYALWRNDPQFVRMHSSELFRYFDEGQYRDDS